MAQWVDQLMHRGVISCEASTTLEEVARRMTDHGISALVVVDQHGALAGIISRTDLVKARVYERLWKNWRALTAGHIMTREVVTVQRDVALEQAAQLLTEHHIHRLVVVDEQDGRLRPIGILSTSDLVRHLAQASSQHQQGLLQLGKEQGH